MSRGSNLPTSPISVKVALLLDPAVRLEVSSKRRLMIVARSLMLIVEGLPELTA